jgi:hypothetical protein
MACEDLVRLSHRAAWTKLGNQHEEYQGCRRSGLLDDEPTKMHLQFHVLDSD